MVKRTEPTHYGKKSGTDGKPVNQRRTLLKALIGVPVLGAFAFDLYQKQIYDQEKKNSILRDLGLEKFKAPIQIKSSTAEKSNLLRVSIVGFGSRAVAHANGLGFMHPLDVKCRRKNGTLDEWLAQDNLNVAITGICDVFDLHAEIGLATARNEIRTGGGTPANIPVKRYCTYLEMLDDKDIDAIMIATPDHHHASMAIAAAQAGKHVYCEKSPAIREKELYELYDTVKSSRIVYQLGHQIHQSAIFRQGKDVLDKDILGKITLIETTSKPEYAGRGMDQEP